MEKRKKNYNLVIGVVALVAVILIIAVSGYFVSRPKPMVVYGEAEAGEYRVSGKVALLHMLTLRKCVPSLHRQMP